VDVNALLEDVLFLLKESFREINIEKNLDASLPSIKGNEAELQNVFLNLLINAKDAMEGRGLLRVNTKWKKHADKKFIVIEIEDTGKGIEEELKSKIFEPYFSTKEDCSNLGMGLYLVDRVIKEHGGFIEIESEKEKGTKFSLYMPVHSTSSAKEHIKEATFKKKDVMKEKSVLIVDDEDMIRELARGVLADTGITIFEAVSGDEAIKIFKKHSDEIDVVFLDVIMPGLKGDEVLKKLREIKNDVKVIISSGFMSEDQRAKLKEYAIEAFLDKPFRDEDIIDIVMEVLSK
jgi:CheY-like chemotaxis protein